MFRSLCVPAVVTALAACGSTAAQPSTAPSARTTTLKATTSRPPPPTTPPAPELSCAVRTLSNLSGAQRVGQLFFMGVASDRLAPSEAAAIDAYHFGSVTFTQTSTAGVAAIRAFAQAVQSHAKTATAGVRFFIAANQEGGEIQALRGPGFSTIPSAVQQGTLSPLQLRADAAEWGRQLAAAGVNLDYAPVLDVVPPGTDAQNQPIGALHREYGHDPGTVAEHGVAFIQGMQSAGITVSAKHFPGLGRVAGNTDFVSGVTDTTTTADDPYLEPFRRTIAAGTPFIMVATARYTKIDANHLGAFSPIVVGDLLRRSLGFDGVVVSDEIGVAKAVSGIPVAERGIGVLEAGGDMVISKTVPPAIAMATAIRQRAESDASFARLVDTSVLRVLEAKERAHLLACA